MEAARSASHGERLAAHGAVSTALSLLSDEALAALVGAAAPTGTGIGGGTARLDVAGTPVFVKRVPLTELEMQPENVRSTADVFGLPAFCHYGFGSPGFGAWRELAAHVMTTDWVLSGECEGFPLLHHWRVLPGSAPLPDELADVEHVVDRWGGGIGVRRRLEGLRQSEASVTLFLEYIPSTLHTWMSEQLEHGDGGFARICAVVERGLEAGTAFMRARGLLHFDAHFDNILTDGRRLYFGDLGLAVSSRFELTSEHAAFVRHHRSYDRCYALSCLVHWLVSALYGGGRQEREVMIQAFARGERPTGVPATVADTLTRHAPLSSIIHDFVRRFEHESRSTPYPLESLRRVGRTYVPPVE